MRTNGVSFKELRYRCPESYTVFAMYQIILRTILIANLDKYGSYKFNFFSFDLLPPLFKTRYLLTAGEHNEVSVFQTRIHVETVSNHRAPRVQKNTLLRLTRETKYSLRGSVEKPRLEIALHRRSLVSSNVTVCTGCIVNGVR